jgi:uncharacterized protein with FMN-binding domain
MLGGMVMKKGVIIAIAVVIVLVILAIVVFNYASKYLDKVSEEMIELEINTVEFDEKLKTIDDGVYVGEYFIEDLLGAKVEVTIEDHNITKVEILQHKHGKGEDAEVITEDIVENQSIGIDVITGATYSSKFILKATENAILK